MSRIAWSTWALVVLACSLVGCPSGSGPDTLPACNPMHGNRDCSDELQYCVRLGGPSLGRCVACRNSRDCDDGNACNGAETCDGFLGCMPGVDVQCPTCHQCIPENGMCSESSEQDDDGDGASAVDCGGTDCDDGDATRFPGNPEVCDSRGHDEDCNTTTYGFRDQDGDDHPDANCENRSGSTSSSGDDCDDTRGDVHPGLAEVCDGIDNDCDGAIDETVLATVYTDVDGDGWGVGSARQLCSGADGYAFQRGDCNDDNAALHPGAFRCAGSNGGIDVCSDAGKWREDTCPGDGPCVAQPNGAGVCWPGATSECANGLDDDGDGSIDAADIDCVSPADASEQPERCNDGIDNDGDYATDYPNDPGCTSPSDADEADPASLPACADGIDNDSDGTADYEGGSGDPGCSAAADGSERDPNGAQCDNGLDDDGNTLRDFPSDPNCARPSDDVEGLPACANGVDDDGDGRTDFIASSNLSDPGCIDAKDDSERGQAPNAPVCDNALDDDTDGASDYPGDVGCSGPGDASE